MEPAVVSDGAKDKADCRRTQDDLPVHSFSTLLADLGTLTLNHASLPGQPDSRFLLASDPTPCRQGRSSCSAWTRTRMLT